MNWSWNFVQVWEVQNLTDNWEEKVVEYGFVFLIQCLRESDTFDEWRILVKPDDECAYTLLLNYELSINKTCYKIEKDLVETECVILKERRFHEPNVKISFRFRVLDTLASQDLTAKTLYRNCELLCEGKSFFVDTTYLASLGGNLFNEWNENYQKGITRIVVIDLSLNELQCLLDGTAKCRQILVTRRNCDELLHVAFRYNIGQILRAIENFLIDATWIHPIRKLEYAAIYKLARLGDCVSRELASTGKAIETLHSYLNENGECLNQVHPDVLLSLNIHPSYVLM